MPGTLHYFKNVNPFSPHHKPMKEGHKLKVVIPGYRGQNWGTGRWNEMPELAQLVSVRTHGLASRSCALHRSALLSPIHAFISFRNCLPWARCWGRNWQCRDKSFYLQEARRLGEEANTSVNHSLACCSGCGTDLRGAQGKANLLLTESLWSEVGQAPPSSQELWKERRLTDRRAAVCWVAVWVSGESGWLLYIHLLIQPSQQLCEGERSWSPFHRWKPELP